MTTPAWSAPHNGLPGDLNATNSADGINQLLGAPAIQELYTGVAVVSPGGNQDFTWNSYGTTTDLAQPITMSGTTIGRVQLPLQPVGNGADVTVSLWPDSGGVPNTSGNPLSQVTLPAAYLNSVAATAGLTAGGPLATSGDNTMYATGGYAETTAWTAPAGSSNGYFSSNAFTFSNGWSITAGGQDPVSLYSVSLVASFSVSAAGVLSLPIPQPALPLPVQSGTLLATSDTLVHVGGKSATSGGPASVVADVWTASWNPNTGVIGTWSAQTALLAPLWEASGAVNGSTVYVVGGLSSTNTPQSTVLYATVTNGQVQAWRLAGTLPAAVAVPMVQIVNGWLIVAGGAGLSSDSQAVYYAKILADGSLGPWKTGPSLAGPLEANAAGNWNNAATDSAMVVWGGLNGNTVVEVDTAQILIVAEEGPAARWTQMTLPAAEANAVAVTARGDGSWALVSMNMNSSTYSSTVLAPVPYVSVPLYASGLTSGATYHVVVQQGPAASASDGVLVGLLGGSPLPASALTHARYSSGSWSSVGAGKSVPLTVWDASVSPNGLARHAVSDVVNGQAQQWMSQFFNSYKLLTGVVDVTMQPNDALNSNPTFTTGVSPWTAVNGTLTQSSAETHGGYPFSGLLTPTGGFTQAHIFSEVFPAQQTPYGNASWYLVTGWFYTPTTWANFSLTVNWYDSSKTYISSSSITASLTGATWTQVSNYVQPPATASYATIDPTMNGSPSSANTLYMSDVFMQMTPERGTALASIAVLDYAAGPPNLTSVTQLN